MKIKFELELKRSKESPTLLEYLKEKDYNVDKSNETIDINKEIERFLEKMEYPIGRCTKKAFEKAIELPEITYETIIESVKRYFLEFTEEQIEKILKYDSNAWSNQKGHPNADLIDLIKYFVSKIKSAK